MAKSKKILSGDGWSFEPAGGKAPAPERISLPPEMQKAKIALEKRPKGKVATTVTGFVLSDSDRKSLTAALKKCCGTGGSDSSEHIEVQGDHRDAVRGFLSKKGWRI